MPKDCFKNCQTVQLALLFHVDALHKLGFQEVVLLKYRLNKNLEHKFEPNYLGYPQQGNNNVDIRHAPDCAALLKQSVQTILYVSECMCEKKEVCAKARVLKQKNKMSFKTILGSLPPRFRETPSAVVGLPSSSSGISGIVSMCPDVRVTDKPDMDSSSSGEMQIGNGSSIRLSGFRAPLRCAFSNAFSAAFLL